MFHRAIVNFEHRFVVTGVLEYMDMSLEGKYRKNGINSRPFITAALSNKQQFLLSKFWALIFKKLIRAAAIKSQSL